MTTATSGSLPFRLIRGVYRILAATLVLALALEVGGRIWAGARAPAGASPSTPADEVTYNLHPYFQMLAPPDEKALRGPFLAGWRVEPPGAVLAPNRFRILFLGGSTTACEYPELVRVVLESALGPVTVYNLAFDWHCSLHSLYKIWTYADDIRPDLVIVLEGVNDFYRGFTPTRLSLPEYRPDYSHYGGPLYAFWRPGRAQFDRRDVFFSRFVHGPAEGDALDPSFGALVDSVVRGSVFLRALGIEPAPEAPPPPRPAPLPSETVLRALPDYERNMGNLALSCRAKGIPLLLLTMPYATGFPAGFLQQKSFFTNDDVHTLSPEEFAKGMDRFNAATLALDEQPAVHAMPLADAIRDKKYFKDEIHLTREGLTMEAFLVARYVQDHRLLTQPRNR